MAGQSSLTPFINIKDGYISTQVTFDTQDSLDEKIYRLTSMMSKLAAQNENQNKQFKPMIYQSKRRGQTRNFYDWHYDQRNYQIIDIGQIVRIGEYCLVVGYNMDRVTETDQGIIRIIELILEEEISEGIWDQIRITEVKTIEMDTEEMIKMIIIKEVEVGLGINSILIIP